ncbi:MAG: LysR family transcriptional regulator [Nitrospiraceae bacterium]|nr:MAG: LysR family transcriptional regulator [Nitrospiraceae bacterium]
MRIRSKIWLEVDGNTVFGSGRKYLLEGISRYGSINKAAKDISISYRKALSYIQAMEDRLGLKLVERKTGGKNGGGANLTSEAKELLQRYEMLEDGVNEMLDRKFKEVFKKKLTRKIR